MLNALQELDLQEIDQIQPEDQERFKITSLDQANWAFRKLAALEAKKQEIKALADAERQRIADYEQREFASLDRSKEFFETLLTVYALEQKENDPKFKAKTPYGSIGFKKQQDKWEYDEQKLVESLKSIGRNDLIRVKEEPNKVDIKKVFSVTVEGQAVDPETGSVVDGIVVTPQPEKVDIKVKP